MKNIQTQILIYVLLIFAAAVILLGCNKTEEYGLYSSKTNLTFAYDQESQSLSFSNISDDPINWNVEAKEPFVYFDRSSGSISSKSRESITIYIDRTQINRDSLETEIYLSSSKDDRVTIKIKIFHLSQDKNILGFNITDAVYDATHNKLFMLRSSSERRIEVFDINTETLMDPIAVPFNLQSYASLVIHPDDSFIGITGNHYFGTLQTDGSTDIVTYYTGEYKNTACFGPDEYVYIAHSSGHNLLKINLLTNEVKECLVDIWFDFEEMHLHPNHRYIYAVGDSYDEYLYKIDISQEEPSIVYRAIIDGFEDQIWINPTGDKIFSEINKYVFINPELTDDDIQSEVEFAFNYSNIADMSFHKDRNEIMIIPAVYNQDLTNRILIYSDQPGLKKTIYTKPYKYVEPYTTGYIEVEALSKFVFNLKGQDKMLVVEEPADYGWLLFSAIEIIDLE